MLRVRFPNGVTVQYNTATWMDRNIHYGWDLYTNKDGKWVASIQDSAGAIVEAVPACAVFQACGDPNDTRLTSIMNDLEKIHAKISKLSTAERKARKGKAA